MEGGKKSKVEKKKKKKMYFYRISPNFPLMPKSRTLMYLIYVTW